jgi:glycosidase
MKENVYVKREKDWRNGAIVYQVLVDRFAPSKRIEEKKELYQYPRTLKTWDQKPEPGTFVKEAKYWSHELDFWGGDLQSVIDKIDYFKALNIDVLYLNPIHESLSNHKYDAKNYLNISPEFGTFKDLNQLSEALHIMGKKIMLDGVFNHVGVDHPFFVDAQKPSSNYRSWFDFNPSYPEGVRLWADVRSLPELNLENENVRDYIYRKENSVIRTYLKQGVDGWRLDVAFDIGYTFLSELTESAHLEKPGSMVVGEIWNYPEKWLQSIDGVMNFTLREIILRLIKKEIPPQTANHMISQMISDAGIEGMLKSWNVLDNHDTPRLSYQLKNKHDQKIAQVMQFTLPGSPNIYYGTELGMEGAGDPVNRAPMRWDLYDDTNETFTWTKQLINLHQSERALKIGDYKMLVTQELIGYERYTENVCDTVIVLINTNDHDVSENILVRDSSLMNYSGFDILLGDAKDISFLAGILNLTIKKKSFVVIKPQTKPTKSYTPYKRV